MPLTMTVPLVGRERPAMMRMVVVLPAPFGSEEAEDLAGRGREAEAVDGREIAVSLCEIVDFDHPERQGIIAAAGQPSVLTPVEPNGRT